MPAPFASSDPADPLASATAYSLHVHLDGWDRDDYFPLGSLFPQDYAQFVSYGFDFTEQSVGPLSPDGGNMMQDWFTIRNQKAGPTPADSFNVGRFEAIWSWHFMPDSVDMGPYGSFTKAGRSYFDPAVRKYLIDSGAQIARLYGASSRPAMLWSLDNEWEGALDYTPRAISGFHDWLRKAYGSVEKLNEAWGASYASFDDAVAPVSEPVISRPAAWLDWHAYQDAYFTQMTADRIQAIVAADPEHRGVAQKITQQSFDLQTVGKKIVMDPAMFADLTRPYDGWYGLDIYDAGDTYLYQVNFAAQCARAATAADRPQKLFLTETNNHGGPGWEFAESMWRALASDVKAFDFYDFGPVGAPEDPAECGLSGPDGLLRSKAMYAARLAYAIRRNEGFWERCTEAKSPRIAMLLNRPDVLLADDIPGQMWSGPANNRIKVYSALRSAGYWVDVLPYTKLKASFLKQYQALVVVGGDHLTLDSDAEIARYVASGGVLLADMGAGRYDTRHQPVDGLDALFGGRVGALDPSASAAFADGSATLTGSGVAAFTPASAVAIASTSSGVPLVFRNIHGAGTVLYAATHLGQLSGQKDDDLSNWLRRELTGAGVGPAYSVEGDGDQTAVVRVEQPQVCDGNLAVVVANTVESPHGAVKIEAVLPPQARGEALWSPAESEELIPIRTERLPDGRTEIALPAVRTSGMLLWMPASAPMISIDKIDTGQLGVDGALPVLEPGKPQRIRVVLINPSARPSVAGRLTVRAPAGWLTAPSRIPTPPLAPGARQAFSVEVTPPTAGVLPSDERFYPINCRWSDGAADRAVSTTPAGVAIERSACPQLLTDNAVYPAGFPRKIVTGATYRFLTGDGAAAFTVRDPASGNASGAPALTDGYTRWLLDDESVLAEHLPASHTAPVEFDLKSAYRLSEVRLLSADFPGYPQGMRVSVSVDGQSFTPAGSAAPEGGPGSAKWLDLKIGGRPLARYVRVDVDLPPSGGRIDEIEIWGYGHGRN